MSVQPWELHPALVHFPIAFLLGAVVLDLFAWYRRDHGAARVATGMLWAGVATAALAALSGLLAMFTGPASHTEESSTPFWWHLGTAVTQFALFTLVAFARWRARPAPPSFWTRMLGLLAAAILASAAYLGGYIVYHGAAGIEPSLLRPDLRQKQENMEKEETESRSRAAIREVNRLDLAHASAVSQVEIVPSTPFRWRHTC